MAEDLEQDLSPNGADEADKRASAGQQADTQLLLNTHYIKDLSFENPNAPLVYAELQKGPEINVNVDVQVRHLQDRLYEVLLTTRVKASVQDKVAFLVELDFGGLATVGTSVPEPEIERLLLVEVPRFLFPFSRAVISDVTRDGGFPPLLINPIDFEELFRNRKEEASRQAQPETA
jgi:preprotein translocase subunit SecB